MARQARSETTRRKILDAAVDLFDEVGYASTGLGDIIERAELTKGALYYHFDSKESLASAIMEEAAGTVSMAVLAIAAASPALESVIHSSFVVAETVRTDRIVRTGSQLARTLGGFNNAVSESYVGILEVLKAQARQATADGDMRADLDTDAVADTMLSAYLGAEALAIPSPDSLARRLTHIWSILLPAIATADALPFLLEFLSREAMRHDQPTLSID